MIMILVKNQTLFYYIFMSASLCIYLIFCRIACNAQREETAEWIGNCVEKLKQMQREERKCRGMRLILIEENCWSKELNALEQDMRIERFYDEKELSEHVLRRADAVFLQLNKKGMQEAHEIRKRSEGIKIYGISEKEEWEDLMQALASGMNGTVACPLRSEIIAEILE